MPGLIPSARQTLSARRTLSARFVPIALAFRARAAWRFAARIGLLLVAPLLAPAAALAVDLEVLNVSPPLNGMGSPFAGVRVTFDRPVLAGSITPATFRVFGKYSGKADGSFAVVDGGRTVVFTPAQRFAAGEVVQVNLARTIQAADSGTLRTSGWCWQFRVQSAPAGLAFQQIDSMSNRVSNIQTRIYGAATNDWNEDGWLDLCTVNEVSADVRVTLNRADGTGLFQPFLPAQGIGVEASPNETADFNNDGHTDLCVAAATSLSLWVCLGAGDGTFSSIVEYDCPSEPHGVTTLDADGDGDSDIISSNLFTSTLSLWFNDGAGAFGGRVDFEGGVNGEYGVVACDMNNDGRLDVVTAGRFGSHVNTMLANATGGFTAAGPAISSGGAVWVVTPGDLDGDGFLDITTANSVSNNGAVLMGNGNGTFDPAVVQPTTAHTASTDLGDLDGDGDLDWVLSVFGSGQWMILTNDGAGNFTFHQNVTAPDNPSCAILLDFDNDYDLDMALTDEIADVILFMKNTAVTGVPAPGGPGALGLLPNTPNPFRGSTTIRFALREAAPLRLDLFDATGRRLARHDLGRHPAGPGEFQLPARDDAGRPLAAGSYFYRLSGATELASGRLVITGE